MNKSMLFLSHQIDINTKECHLTDPITIICLQLFNHVLLTIIS